MSVDFRELRLACLKASDCNRTVVETAGKIVQDGFVNMEAHIALAEVYPKLNEPAKAKFHLDVTTALMRSIFMSGDGKTKRLPSR